MSEQAPIYMVSGWVRHGTSMMMHALETGGLDAAYSVQGDQRGQRRWNDGAYNPNSDGFYELDPQDYRSSNFPAAYRGRLIKCLRGGVLRLPPDCGPYRIVYMRRDGEETRQSMQALFSQDIPPDRAQVIERETALMSGILHQRADCDVTVVWYRDVIEDPLAQFQRVADAGWPIDARVAAETVKPELCRFRKELLDEGV